MKRMVKCYEKNKAGSRARTTERKRMTTLNTMAGEGLTCSDICTKTGREGMNPTGNWSRKRGTSGKEGPEGEEVASCCY